MSVLVYNATYYNFAFRLPGRVLERLLSQVCVRSLLYVIIKRGNYNSFINTVKIILFFHVIVISFSM